jgi:hypothetical protein
MISRGLAAALLTCGVSAAAPAYAALSTADDRIGVSLDGASLTGTNGGGGASLSWLHNFDADSLAGVAAEHQVLGNAHWTVGSLNGSLVFGPAEQRYGIYAEAHEGAGDDGAHPFHYAIEAVGVTGTYFHRLTALLEDRQIDVEATHGNLPKLGISYLWGPHLMTSLSYASSVTGNLGTHLAAARIDGYGPSANFFAGVALGQVAPTIILNFQSGLSIPGRQLHEGYVGLSKPMPRLRSELTLVADYQDLTGIKHATVTLNYIFHVGHGGAVR